MDAEAGRVSLAGAVGRRSRLRALLPCAQDGQCGGPGAGARGARGGVGESAQFVVLGGEPGDGLLPEGVLRGDGGCLLARCGGGCPCPRARPIWPARRPQLTSPLPGALWRRRHKPPETVHAGALRRPLARRARTPRRGDSGSRGMPARPPSARMVSSTLTSALAALMGRTAAFKTSRILLAGTSLMWIVTPGRGPLAGLGVSLVPVLPSSGL